MLNTEIQKINTMKDRLFIAQQADKFERYLAMLDDDTRHIIRKNKQLNDLYDLFLDFILDSNQHLELSNAAECVKQLE